MDTTRAYYERRAAEYERTSWGSSTATLAVGVGTGFLTSALPGPVVALDQSGAMLRQARARLRDARLVRALAARLPFADGAFGRVFASHLYGHLEPEDRRRFLDEARRVAGELVIVDERATADSPPDDFEERSLDDCSRHLVYKRRVEPAALLAELGGVTQEALFEGALHLVVRSR